MAYMRLTYKSECLNQTTDISVFFPYVANDNIIKNGKRNKTKGDPGRANHKPTMGGAGKPVEIALKAQLPMDDGTYDKRERFQVLYLLSGGGGDFNDWSIEAGIEDYCTKGQLLVVMPTVRDFNRAVKGSDYYKFIAEELPQFIQFLFPVSDQREDNFIGGFSYGAYFATQIGLNYADRFSHIASFCGPLDIIMDLTKLHAGHDSAAKVESIRGTDRDIFWKLSQMKKNNEDIPRIFISVGTEDFTWDFNQSAKKFMEENDIDFTWTQGPGIHSYIYCTQHFEEMLDWLPLKHGAFIPRKEEVK